MKLLLLAHKFFVLFLFLFFFFNQTAPETIQKLLKKYDCSYNLRRKLTSEIPFSQDKAT